MAHYEYPSHCIRGTGSDTAGEASDTGGYHSRTESRPKETQTAVTEMKAAENSKGVNIMSITEMEMTPDFDRYLRVRSPL